MNPLTLLASLSAALASGWLTGWLRRHALRANWLDVPNARSSHSAPTPRGGGLAIVIAASGAFAVLWAAGVIDARLGGALLGVGLVVAATGFQDDRRAVAPLVRLGAHLAAATAALALLGGLPALQVGARLVDLGLAGDVLGALAIAWTLNLYNFMDGIDGIAAGEAAFIGLAVAVLAALGAGGAAGSGVAAAALVFAAACAGFLAWNWPPARIFLGDVGSGYLGYVIAVLAIAHGRSAPAAPWIWLSLGAAFFADASVTLGRRLARGERPHQAHRTHAYQWLARRWHGHRPVTLALLAANCVLSLPLAAWGARAPQHAGLAAALSVGAWVALAWLAGAGRAERAMRPPTANRDTS
jgi:Fuc2NAc and GlcNAc transferase